MPYFESLKKTLKHINSEVTELKKIDPALMFNSSELFDPAPGIPPLDDEEMKKQISEMKFLVKHTRSNTLHLKSSVHKCVDLSYKFRYDIEDLYYDVDSASRAVEKRLMQFGYCPPKLKTCAEVDADTFPSKDPTTHQNDSEEIAKSVTPKLQIHKISPDPSTAVGDCNIKKKDETPVLSLDLANKDFRALIVEKKEEFDELPVLKSARKMSKKKAKYKEIARKLDF
ncbi:hypothetical protein JTE90_027053 [Oedothorax gibbosus]|uniref:Uncharacterized protein n=1 Tax=Oedothorax gibbosus TaxID=931172 RepID=A0AAV6U3T6_9ARAC|nr:hypothetical protein JTE90_027053 [Oedothorax gibbosus]